MCGRAPPPRTPPGVCSWVHPAREPPPDLWQLIWPQTGWVQIPALLLLGLTFPTCKMG